MPLTRTRGIVCVVTDRRRLLPDGTPDAQRRALLEQAAAAGFAGVDVFQVRERDLSARELYALVRDVLAAIGASSTRVVVNDRLDVALAAGAHGVHLRGASLPPSAARAIGPERLLIGQSLHSGDRADKAADFALFGTVFPSGSKEAGHGSAGVEALANASRHARIPVLAIGGISDETVAEVAPVSSGIAAIGWFATRDGGRMSDRVRYARHAFDTITPVI